MHTLYAPAGAVSSTSQGEGDLPAAGMVGRHPDPGLLEHEPGGNAGIAVVVFVVVIDDFLDARLDDGLGALVAGEEGYINPGALQVVVGAVQDGVQLGMQTYIYLVSRGLPSRSQGIASSSQPMGMPL